MYSIWQIWNRERISLYIVLYVPVLPDCALLLEIKSFGYLHSQMGARTTQHFLTWFGSCGQVQTGSFIDIAAPNGLFGLGFEKVSVPSILFREGYIANSFSMCFGRDGTGRLNFGDKGSLDQEETPFNMNSFQSVRISLIFTLHIVVCSYPWYRADTSTFCFL